MMSHFWAKASLPFLHFSQSRAVPDYTYMKTSSPSHHLLRDLQPQINTVSVHHIWIGIRQTCTAQSHLSCPNILYDNYIFFKDTHNFNCLKKKDQSPKESFICGLLKILRTIMGIKCFC